VLILLLLHSTGGQLPASSWPPQNGLPTRVVKCTNGQEFLDATRSLREGENLVMDIAPYIELDDPTLRLSNATGPITTSTLTWIGAPGHSTLSIGSRFAATSILAPNSVLYLTNIRLEYGCRRIYDRLPPLSQFIVPSSTEVWFFALRTRAGAPNTLSKLVEHTGSISSTAGETELSLYIYQQVLFDLGRDMLWVRPYMDRWLSVMPHPQAVIRTVERGKLDYAYTNFAQSTAWNYTIVLGTSLPPTDPPRVLRVCETERGGGRPLNPDELALNRTMVPYWVVEGDAELGAALHGVSEHFATVLTRDWPADIMLLANTSLAAAVAGVSNDAGSSSTTPTPVSLPGMAMMTGPFNHMPATAKTVMLSMGRSVTPLLLLPTMDFRIPGQAARLLISKLVLTDLAAAPLAPLLPPEAPAPSKAYVSALPLWALGLQARTQQVQVWLYRCRVVVPRADYAALLSAALRVGDGGAGAWAIANGTSAPLFAGITQFEPAEGITPLSTSLVLLHYSGWGVSASSTTFVPDSAWTEADAAALPDWQGAGGVQGASSSGDINTGLAAGLAVGLGLGIPVVTIAAAAAYVLHARRAPAVAAGPQPAAEGSGKKKAAGLGVGAGADVESPRVQILHTPGPSSRAGRALSDHEDRKGFMSALPE